MIEKDIWKGDAVGEMTGAEANDEFFKIVFRTESLKDAYFNIIIAKIMYSSKRKIDKYTAYLKFLKRYNKKIVSYPQFKTELWLCNL